MSCSRKDEKPKKYEFSFIVLSAIMLLLLTLFMLSGEANGEDGGSARVFYVDDDATPEGNGSIVSPFNSIQGAVLVAREGDTIRIWDGHYNEPVIIKKGLTIIGNGTGKTHTERLEFSRGNSVIMGLSIRCPSDVPAIWIKESVSNITILRCSVRGESPMFADWGIYAKSPSDIEIKDSTFDNCDRGIEIHHGKNIVIENSTFTNNTSGIRLITSRNSRIIGCTFVHNDLGIYIFESDHTDLKNNHFRNNKKNIEEVKKVSLFSEGMLYLCTICIVLALVVLVANWKAKRDNSSDAFPRQYHNEEESAERSKHDSHIPESPSHHPHHK